MRGAALRLAARGPAACADLGPPARLASAARLYISVGWPGPIAYPMTGCLYDATAQARSTAQAAGGWIIWLAPTKFRRAASSPPVARSPSPTFSFFRLSFDPLYMHTDCVQAPLSHLYSHCDSHGGIIEPTPLTPPSSRRAMGKITRGLQTQGCRDNWSLLQSSPVIGNRTTRYIRHLSRHGNTSSDTL